jgi:SAM-dependent methyltransferase
LLNWRIRYHRLIEANPELNDPGLSVAEVGSGGAGIARVLGRHVVGVEPDGNGAALRNLTVVKGDILALPFADGEVDVVVCMDVMAQVAPDQRKAAIAELVRVARQKVLISCPCHRWALEGEGQLNAGLARLGLAAPAWLARHLRNGLPMIQDILAPIIASPYEFEVCGNETMTQHYAGLTLDMFYPPALANDRVLASKSGWRAPVGGNEWDFYYSFLYTIHKTRRRGARVAAPVEAAMSSAPSQRIYAVYHKKFPTGHLRGITPIFIGDDPGEKPAGAVDAAGPLDHRRWSELSAMHHVWTAGERTDVVGFCHYRRLFDFGGGGSGGRQTKVSWSAAAAFQGRMIDFDVIAQCRDGAIITAMPEALEQPVFDYYCLCHSTQDYLAVFSDVCNRHPELAEGLMAHFETGSLYANNLFVMSWALFDELCRLWMDVLLPFAAKHPDRGVGAYQTRDVSFLSERIFDAWIRSKKRDGTKVIELPILFME